MKPVIVQVFGDPKRKLEPEHHRIEFPGGFISVDRTTDGNYWAHIALTDEIKETHQGKGKGRVISSRVDFNFAEYKRRNEAGEPSIPDIPGMSDAQHFAVCIGVDTVEDTAEDSPEISYVE